MFNKLKKIFSQRGATTILLAFFVMSVLLMMALTAAGIMIYQIQMSKEAASSVPAFFAADAGAEKCLYQARKLATNSGDDCTKQGQTIEILLDNGARGFAEWKAENQIQAWGFFGSTQRQVELSWSLQAPASTPTPTPSGVDSNVKLLLHADNVGSNVFYDSSLFPKTVTANGNATQRSDQFKFPAGSAYFDGSGDYLTIADSADWYFGDGDFTVDFWVRFNNFPPLASPYWGLVELISQGSGSTPGSWSVMFDKGDNVLRFAVWNNSGTQVIGVASQSLSWATGVWYHLAVVRDNNKFTLYRDGNSIGTDNDNDALPDISSVLTISGDAPHANYFLDGYLDELRVSKGIARWTANFTPPAAPY